MLWFRADDGAIHVEGTISEAFFGSSFYRSSDSSIVIIYAAPDTLSLDPSCMNMSNCFQGSVAALGMKKAEAKFMNVQYR
jgi:hypothetical protein